MMMKGYLFILATLLCACSLPSQENVDNIDTQLYLGQGDNQPLIVAFGGGDGGNAWTSDRVKKKREQLIDSGYAFLALGYFNTENTPKVLDRISLNDIHQAIFKAANNPKVDKDRIAVLGVSKGGELALLLASHFNDITCVVAMVPSHCSFPAHTLNATTSSWSFNGQEVPFVPMKKEALPALLRHDLFSAFTIMLEDKEAVEKATISVEKINGPILLLSAEKDEQWPSTEMSNAVMDRLKRNQYKHTYEHVAINGRHSEVFDHFDTIYQFLEKNFPIN